MDTVGVSLAPIKTVINNTSRVLHQTVLQQIYVSNDKYINILLLHLAALSISILEATRTVWILLGYL